MKTIFITSFHLLISRNILSTPILTILSQHVRVVVLVPDYKAEYFRKAFGGQNIIVEGVAANQASKRRSGLFFKRLFQMMLNTESIRILQGYRIHFGKTSWYESFFHLAQFFGKSLLIIRFSRFLDFHIAPKHLFRDVIQRYKPDLIFATDMLNENDVSLMQDARRAGIRTLGMIRSWDNLSVLSLMRIIPNHLMLWNERLKREAMTFNGVEEARISLVGIPHYDRYLQGPTMSRDAFLKKIDADPSKPTIFFAPIGDLYIHKNDTDRNVFDILSKLDANIIVRFPPFDTVGYLEDFKKPAHMYFDKPGVEFSDGIVSHKELSRADDDMLLDGIYYSDVVVTGPSTIVIEGALLGKPIVLINFHKEKRSFYEGLYSYNYTHIRPILESGGVRMAESGEAMAKDIQSYLKDSSQDAEGRKRIIREQCWQTDGASSRRVADVVLKELSHL